MNINLSNLINNLPGMAYSFTFNINNENNNKILFVSEGCLNLTGYSPQELLLKTQGNYYNLILPQDIYRIKEKLSSCIQQQHFSYELEYRIITSTNEIKWVLEKGFIVNKNLSNRIEKYLEGFITDISKQKKAEEEISLLYDLT